jgi:hypothetical protein
MRAMRIFSPDIITIIRTVRISLPEKLTFKYTHWNKDHEDILTGNEGDPLTGNEDNASDLSVEVHQLPHLLPQGVVRRVLAPALVPHLHLIDTWVKIKPVLPTLSRNVPGHSPFYWHLVSSAA